MQAVYQLTLQAIQKAVARPVGDMSEDDVGQQAVEFWSTVSDEELELIEEAEETGAQPSTPCQNFVRGALPHLVPLLLEAMCKQEEDDDDDSWNMAMAAATCLARVAQTVENPIVEHVMPFIQEHITSADWRRREAATLAFGSILEGPSQSVLAQFMEQALDVMMKLMKDPSIQVKDTAAWTIGRICEHHIQCITAGQWQAQRTPFLPRVAPHSSPCPTNLIRFRPFSLTHPFLPYVAPHSSHIPPIELSLSLCLSLSLSLCLSLSLSRSLALSPPCIHTHSQKLLVFCSPLHLSCAKTPST